MDVAALLPSLDGPSSEVAQVIALLGAAGFDEPEHLSVGDGDRHLLALYRSVTGEALEVLVSCPACGELSEAEIDSGELPPSGPRLAVLGRRRPTRTDVRRPSRSPRDPAPGGRRALQHAASSARPRARPTRAISSSWTTLSPARS